MDTTMIADLGSHVTAYIRRHALIAPRDVVVVAVSGGADSLCLLHVLLTLAPDLGCRLHVAHLDHALRPASAADAEFVATHAADLGLPCAVDRRDAGAVARRQRLSLETAARIVRYAFLREVAAATGAAVIATGHTRDDQAETLLLHLARGSGLNGLAGMPPRRDDLIRPLLEVGRADTVAYCATLGLAPREDESNLSPLYRRNHIRHAILPRLEEMQPSAGANIARAARLLAADLALVERLAAGALTGALTHGDGGSAGLSVARWAEAAPELRPHMLRLLLVRLLGHAEGFGERDYARILAAFDPVAGDVRLSLPKGLSLLRRGDLIVLGPRSSAGPIARPAAFAESRLAIPGCVRTDAGVLRAEYAVAPLSWDNVPRGVAYLDPVATGADLRVRPWRAGDRVRPLGLGGARKVQDVFVDGKVPRDARACLPIVEGAHGIAWVAGLCTGEAYRVAAGAAAVRLTWQPCRPIGA